MPTAKKKHAGKTTSASTMAAPAHPAFTDIKTLRKRARENLDKGPITTSYTIDRKELIRKLNDSLATEWVCVLRYMRHYFSAAGMLAESVRQEFLTHAQEEQGHADLLAQRIVQLGGDPDLNPATLSGRSHAEYKEGKDLRDMVKENLIAERIAIDSYRELINWIGDRDTTTKRMLEGILAMEEDHADDFRDLLNGWIGD